MVVEKAPAADEEAVVLLATNLAAMMELN